MTWGELVPGLKYHYTAGRSVDRQVKPLYGMMRA